MPPASSDRRRRSRSPTSRRPSTRRARAARSARGRAAWPPRRCADRSAGAARSHQDARSSASPTSNRARCCPSRRRASSGSRSTSTERERARRAGAGRDEGGDVPARACLSPAVAQREARAGVRRREREADPDRRQRRQRHAVRHQTKGDARIRTPISIPISSRRPTCCSRPASRSTPASSPTSSASAGAPPDAEIPSLTLLNSYTARLVHQNEVNLREAWLRTELFSQKLALSAGRLDLTNYFDRNATANDETTQFISDAL